jgi:RHS repeat-associated protein
MGCLKLDYYLNLQVHARQSEASGEAERSRKFWKSGVDVEYVPFGEVFLEEKNAKWNTPYLFTSMELDKETGWNYFGARYQDPKLGIFLSVDPLAEKYAGMSSYAYVANNPVKFVDPDGKRIKIGSTYYSYEKDRNYDKIKNNFERNAYKALDYLYSTKALEVTIGEGKDSQTIKVLDILINDKKNTIKIQEGKTNLHKDGKISFNPSNGIAFFKDLENPYSRDGKNNPIANYGTNSPSSILAHELIHGYNSLYDKEFKSRRSDSSTQGLLIDSYGRNFSFPNAEEKYTTKLSNQVNRTLGEDERSNYGIVYYPTIDVTSLVPAKNIPIE